MTDLSENQQNNMKDNLSKVFKSNGDFIQKIYTAAEEDGTNGKKVAIIATKYLYELILPIYIYKYKTTEDFKNNYWLLDWFLTQGISTTVDLALAYKEKTNVSFEQAWKSLGGLGNLSSAATVFLDALRLANLINAFSSTKVLQNNMEATNAMYDFVKDYVTKYDMDINNMKNIGIPDVGAVYFHELFYHYIKENFEIDLDNDNLFLLAYLALDSIRQYGDGGNFKVILSVDEDELNPVCLSPFNLLYWMPPKANDEKIKNIWDIHERLDHGLEEIWEGTASGKFDKINPNYVNSENVNLIYNVQIISEKGIKYLYINEIQKTINYNDLIYKKNELYEYYHIYPKITYPKKPTNGILIPIYGNELKNKISNEKDPEIKKALTLLMNKSLLDPEISIDYEKWLYSPIFPNELVEYSSLIVSGDCSETKYGELKFYFLNKEQINTDRKTFYHDIYNLLDKYTDVKIERSRLLAAEISWTGTRDVLSKTDVLKMYKISKLPELDENLTPEEKESKVEELMNAELNRAEVLLLCYRTYMFIEKHREN